MTAEKSLAAVAICAFYTCKHRKYERDSICQELCLSLLQPVWELCDVPVVYQLPARTVQQCRVAITPDTGAGQGVSGWNSLTDGS